MKQSGTIPGWGFLSIGLALGLSLAWFLHAALEPIPGAAAGESMSMRQATAELAAIRGLLAQLVERPEHAQAPADPVAPQPLQPAADVDLARAVRDLAIAVQRLPVAGRAGGGLVPDSATRAAAPTLKDLSQRVDTGHSQVVPELFGLAPDAVLQRYGVPNSEAWIDKDTRWYYWLDAKGGAESPGNRLTFVFHDGYLSSMSRY